jgi:hypothetical protein
MKFVKKILLHHFESINDLFTLQSIIELFGFNENQIFLLKIQDFLINGTFNSISRLKTLHLFTPMNEYKFYNLFNDYNFFSVKDLENTKLFQINQILIKNIETAGIEFTESTPTLRLVYPNFHDLIVDYELAVVEDDGSMMDDSLILDTKLHYPEPFVASPSFVDEDL